MNHHTNDPICLKCEELFEKYPGFNEELRTWFNAIRVEHPEAHISCAGRGRIDQEVCFQRRASKAHWRESAHNWNSAIDIFELREGQGVWSDIWFNSVIEPNLYPALEWYGGPKAVYFELPHVEIANWRSLASQNLIHLVE